MKYPYTLPNAALARPITHLLTPARGSRLLPLLLLGSLAARAQAPGWQSVMALDTNGGSQVTATAADASGNIVVAGTFTGTIQLGGTTLASAGERDVFVAKWNPAGNRFTWALRAGGTGNDYGTSLAVQGSSVYVGGTFLGTTATIGSTVLTNASPTGDNADGFVAKLTDAGPSASWVWAQQQGGTGGDNVEALAVAGTSLYLTGTLGTGPFTLGGTTLTSVGNGDMYVAKLVDAGSTSSYAWAQQGGGPDYDYANALAVSGNSVYVTGGYNGGATFGTTTVGHPGSSNGGSYLAKLTDAGTTSTFTWAQQVGDVGNLFVNGLTATGSSVYAVGGFTGGRVVFGSTTLTAADNSFNTDMYVVKLTDTGGSGSYEWAQRGGGTAFDQCSSVVVQGSSVYVSGNFSSPTADFGATTLTKTTTDNTTDVYVAKLTDAGHTSSWTWAQSAGSPSDDYAYTLVMANSRLYLGGTAGLPATFGTLTLPATTATYGSFLAAVGDGKALASAAPTALAGIALYPSPAHGTATVRLPGILGTPPAILTLLDALGRVVRTATAAPGPNYALDLIGLAPGVYALRVRAEGGEATRRLVVE